MEHRFDRFRATYGNSDLSQPLGAGRYRLLTATTRLMAQRASGTGAPGSNQPGRSHDRTAHAVVA